MLHFSLEGQIPSAATAALPAVRVTTGLSHTRKEQVTDKKNGDVRQDEQEGRSEDAQAGK